jgi:signal transduction histidine kinase
MQANIDTIRAQYAVIEAVFSDKRSERCVVAYVTEKSLHELVFEGRILAYGFQSRNDATAFAHAAEFRDTALALGRSRRFRRQRHFLARVAHELARPFVFIPASLRMRYARAAFAANRQTPLPVLVRSM